MPEVKTTDFYKTADTRPCDGTILDGDVDTTQQLPHGLTRLPSGAIAVTRLYCPNGHNLIERSAARFNLLPGITVRVRGKYTYGELILSPIHGDDSKFGDTDFEPGEVLRISCPHCDSEFPAVQPCGCRDGSMLVGFFLDKSLIEGSQVVICNAWGCLRSRILDRFQIISKLE